MSNIKFYAPVDFDDTSSGLTIDGDLIVDTNTLFVDVSADKVGIGTVSPSGELHIKSASANANFYIQRSTYDPWRFSAGSTYLAFMQDASEKMRIDSSGNLGLGTASPSGKLHIAPDANSNYVFTGTSTSGYTATFNIDDTGLDIGHNSSGRALNLKTNSADRLTITGSGNVLIGTTTDSGYKLDVSGKIAMLSDGTLLWGSAFDFGKLTYDTGKAIVRGASGKALSLGANNTQDTIYINTSQNVGIGTTSPSHKLHVNGGNIFGSSNVLATNNVYAAGPQGFVFGSSTSEGEYIYRSGNDIRIHANSGDRLTVLGTGAVGIGTTSPSVELEVGGSTNTQVLISTTNTTGNSQLYFGDSASDTAGVILYRHDGDSMAFEVNDSERMRIISDGSVGIGTTSPLGRLHVEDSSVRSSVNSGANNIVIEENGYSGITILSSNLNAGQIHFGDQDAENAGMIQYFHSDNSMRLTTNAGERMRITSGGNVLIGTTTDGGYKLNVNGTAFAQTAYVDDYIYHAGDTNTAVGFLDDAIEFYAGGVKMIKLTEGSADVVTVNPDSADVNFQVHGDTVANLLFVDGGTSKVGIGTSSPAYRLDIKGTSNNIGDGNQIFSVGNTAGGTQLAIGSSEDSYTWIRSYESGVGGRDLALVTNGEAVRIKSLGNVLIGTTTDSGQKLQVNGSVLASDYIGSTHIYLSSPDSWIFRSTGGTERMRLTSAGNLGIGTSSPAYKLDVTGELRATSVLRANSNAIVGGYIDLTGDFFHRSDIKVLNKAANNWLIWAQRDTAASEVVVDLNYIGTITPGSDSAYDIGTNTVRFANGYFDTLYGDGSNLTGITATETDTLDSVTGRGATTTNSITVGGLTVDTSTLHVDASNNRVGVGTTAPSAKLDIVGDGADFFLQSNDFKIARIQPRGTAADLDKGLFSLFDGSTEDVRIDTAGNSWLNGGNVGIGTTSPSSLLQVQSGVGNTQLDGHQILLSRAGNNHVFATSGSGVLALGTGNSEKMRITSGGNILVGTTTDSGFYKVDVDGPTRITGDTSTNGTVRFSSDKGTNNSHVHYGTNGDWYIRSATASGKVVIQDAGAVVGIGTASPSSSYKLDVNGDTNVAGDYYVNGNQGWSGTISINATPPVSITVEGGIITNVT